MKNIVVQNKRTYCLKVLSPQRILFWKRDKCCYKQRKATWLRINYICEHKYCVNPKGKCAIVPPLKNCCFNSLDFHMKQLTCIANQPKALFHGAHILRTWVWRNSEVCTNSEYTWIVQPIVWTLNPYEWKPRAQQTPFTRVYVCELKKLKFKSSTEHLLLSQNTHILVSRESRWRLFFINMENFKNHLFFIL
jgi:hypothetical protein